MQGGSMDASQWPLWLIFVVIAVYTVLVYQANRLQEHRGEEGNRSAATVARSGNRDETVLKCPGCGAENEVGYRYCRSCVAELPVTVDFERPAEAPMGRVLR